MIKDLNSTTYTVRKESMEKALKLPYKEMLALISILEKSDIPELTYCKKQLKLKIPELKKNEVFPLPRQSFFKFNKEFYPISSIEFSLSLVKEKYHFKTKDLRIVKVIIGDDSFEGNDLPIFDQSVRENGDFNVFTWTVPIGRDSIFPKEGGEHDIVFEIQNPDNKWRAKCKFKRKYPKEKDAFNLLIKNGLLIFYARNYFEEGSLEQKLLIAEEYIKAYSDSSNAEDLKISINRAVADWLWYSNCSQEKMILICQTLNRIGNAPSLKKLIDRKEKLKKEPKYFFSLDREHPGISMEERVSLLEKHLKFNYKTPPESIVFNTPEVVTPFKADQLQISDLKQTSAHLNIISYKTYLNGLLINDKLQGLKFLNPKTYSPDIDFLLDLKPGNYTLEIEAFIGCDLFKFKNIKFNVAIPETEKEALKEFRKFNLPQFFSSSHIKYDIENLEKFLQKFPKSYLSKELQKRLISLIKRDLRNEITFSKKERLILAQVLSEAVREQIFPEIITYHSTRNNVCTQFWYDTIEKRIPPAPENFTFTSLKEAYLPYEHIKFIKSKGFEGFRYFIDLAIDDNRIDKNSFKSKYFKFNKVNNYRVNAVLSDKKKTYRMREFEIKVILPDNEKEAYKNFPAADFEKILLADQHLLKSYDRILSFVTKYPKSRYSKLLGSVMEFMTVLDSMGEVENFDDKRKQTYLKVLNLTVSSTLYEKLNKSLSKHEKINNFWLENLIRSP